MNPTIGRRAVLSGLAGGGVSLALSGCAEIGAMVDPRGKTAADARTLPPDTAEGGAIHTVMRRATFGPDGSHWPVDRTGFARWLDDQLRAPTEIPGPGALVRGSETWGLRWRLNSLESLRIGEPWTLGGRTFVAAGNG
ncbi:MAG: hypothetical protein ACKO5K_11425, partial [Armatimonadota bacterium]